MSRLDRLCRGRRRSSTLPLTPPLVAAYVATVPAVNGKDQPPVKKQKEPAPAVTIGAD